ncbi:MAG: hypothetical protein M2R45_03846 [Verrucomicrobia subdivision 3 bacterium]|nr:hypothetical protein [Limisphaerales bacterium]MCS1415802.1 hypothetical protein [Limisphaerales bacterium]
MKRDIYERGIRGPFIVRWPKHFPARKNSDLISGFQDIFPTFVELAGTRPPHPLMAFR